MNLYLLRHANALAVGEQGVQTDEDRPLSEEGLQRVALLAGALKRLGLTFDQALASPLRRSMQTAEELVRQMGKPQPDVTACGQMAPGTPSKKLAKHLLGSDAKEILLVGHEPELSKHTAWLIGSKDARLEFAKGGIACVRCDGVPQKGGGTLAWLLTPKWLTALTGTEVAEAG
jgi:phosphohistidine phosphatase